LVNGVASRGVLGDGGDMTGRITRLMTDKGFGFIRADDCVEYFFHRSGIVVGTAFDELRVGQSVTFVVGQSAKGPRAEQVEPSPPAA
jgi:CspA family cold shock protein